MFAGWAKEARAKDDKIFVFVQQVLAAGVCFVLFLLVPGHVLLLRLKCYMTER